MPNISWKKYWRKEMRENIIKLAITLTDKGIDWTCAVILGSMAAGLGSHNI